MKWTLENPRFRHLRMREEETARVLGQCMDPGSGSPDEKETGMAPCTQTEKPSVDLSVLLGRCVLRGRGTGLLKWMIAYLYRNKIFRPYGSSGNKVASPPTHTHTQISIYKTLVPRTGWQYLKACLWLTDCFTLDAQITPPTIVQNHLGVMGDRLLSTQLSHSQGRNRLWETHFSQGMTETRKNKTLLKCRKKRIVNPEFF